MLDNEDETFPVESTVAVGEQDTNRDSGVEYQGRLNDTKVHMSAVEAGHPSIDTSGLLAGSMDIDGAGSPTT